MSRAGAVTNTASYGSPADMQIAAERLATGYTSVSKGYTAKPYTGGDSVTVIADSIAAGNAGYLTSDNYGYSSSVAALRHGDEIEVSVEVPQTALYSIGFDYLSYDSSILPIEFSLMIDGKYDFYEMRSLKFETSWVAKEEKSYDRYGNEIVTLPDKLIRWENKQVSDSGYRYSLPLAVQLEAGVRTFTISVSEGTFLLGNITLSAPAPVAAYSGSQKAEGSNLITIEGEDFYIRNDSSIHAVGEYSSSVSPAYTRETILNTLDEDSFTDAGQAVTYRFDVSDPGYYYFALNYRQSEKNGFPVFFDIRVDGQIPNSEFNDYPLEYAAKYTTSALTDADGNKLSVYLDKGEHTISFTISEDPVRYALEAVDAIMSGISDLSLEVTKVAGTNKDKYRDLKLNRYIPDIEERLYGWVADLYSIAGSAAELVGAKNAEDVAAFAYLIIAAKQLKSLADEPNELVYRVDELATSTNSINTQLANFVDIIGKNNTAIDRIYVFQGEKVPSSKAGFFESIGLSLGRFVYSFFGQSYSSSNTDKTHIQVWVNRPRQYVEIMQKMIDDQFTKKTGIMVDLSLMTDAQKLILSNASGDTPDIATGINYSIPFEIGVRGALVDLTKFDDYREIFGRYSDGLLVPSIIGDGLYSLPETMNFYVLFYRTDILGKLGLEVPETIDDLIAMLPDLQMRGLNAYYPTGAMLTMRNFHGVTPLIFQKGGTLYGRTAQDLMIDSEETIEGFTTLTDLFTLYNMPVDVPNFYQHFRNGDIPVGIADFNSYNLILNAAPEIENSWSIAPVPGVRDEETGEICRYMSGGAESTVMFKSNDEREQQAWEFMKWWSEAEVQAEFGQMVQIMYGDEYIWPTANLEAFAMLPYPSSDKDIIMEQAGYILEAPRLLGSYMLERELSNAFNDVVVNGETVRSRIDEAVKIVNRETARKLEEFGYIDADGNIISEYEVPSVERVREILGKQ
jgi:ABC-type glycerol-3-phosphate transport system substrate-binding protein